jgi:hypothetical protein
MKTVMPIVTVGKISISSEPAVEKALSTFADYGLNGARTGGAKRPLYEWKKVAG